MATHGKAVSDIDSHKAIEALFYFTKWFVKSYSQNGVPHIGIFDFHLLPKEGSDVLSKKQTRELEQELEEKLTVNKEELSRKEKKDKNSYRAMRFTKGKLRHYSRKLRPIR